MYATKLCVSDTDLIRVLLGYGPSHGLEMKDMDEGNTPLHWAIVGGVMSPYALSPLLKVSPRDHRGVFVPLNGPHGGGLTFVVVEALKAVCRGCRG